MGGGRSGNGPTAGGGARASVETNSLLMTARNGDNGVYGFDGDATVDDVLSAVRSEPFVETTGGWDNSPMYTLGVEVAEPEEGFPDSDVDDYGNLGNYYNAVVITPTSDGRFELEYTPPDSDYEDYATYRTLEGAMRGGRARLAEGVSAQFNTWRKYGAY